MPILTQHNLWCNISIFVFVQTVFAIKGAASTRCAQCGCPVHTFKTLCTRHVHIYSTIIPLYKKVHEKTTGCMVCPSVCMQ